jgi:hypothetical protein
MLNKWQVLKIYLADCGQCADFLTWFLRVDLARKVAEREAI